MAEKQEKIRWLSRYKERAGLENLPVSLVLRTKNKPNPCNPPWFVVN